MQYVPVKLRKDLNIGALYAVHYLELLQDFSFPGETHEFWELVYVDQGEVIVTSAEKEFSMARGSLFFHAPGEFHAMHSGGQKAANVMILNFECRSKFMERFAGKYFRSLTDTQRELLRAILNESRKAFSSRLDDPYDNSLVRAKDAPFGSEQLLAIFLTELLLNLYRQMEIHINLDEKLGAVPMLDAIISYMEGHLTGKLTLKQLADEFHISTSYIQRLFSQYKKVGAIHYFTAMKIERAKQLLREKNRNISQISEMLGYDNTYYFCNQFKKFTGKSSIVTVKMNGKKELIDIKIDIKEIEPDEVELLQDMITVAFNDAMKQIDKDTESKMGKYTQGMPGLF